MPILIFHNDDGTEGGRMVVPPAGTVRLACDDTVLRGADIDPATFPGTKILTFGGYARTVDAVLPDEGE